MGGEVNRIKIKSEEKLIHSAEPCAVLFSASAREFVLDIANIRIQKMLLMES